MIKHSVIFNLNTETGSVEEQAFIAGANKLSAIDTVKNFAVMKQVSEKNPYAYCISMEFDDKDDYLYYSHHPEHEKFLEEFWKKYVTDFLEIDLAPLK